jgi:hypothetical protein
MQRIIIEKRFFFMVRILFMVRSVCHIKWFTTVSRNCHLGGKFFTDNEEVEPEVWKWLRQQLKDFYAAGFNALVKQWDKCINNGGGYVEK